jgi:phosphate-selective porin OprO/OprP
MPIDASPLGGTWRLAYVPWHQPHRVLHFGLSAWQQTTAPDRSVDFSTTPELPLHRGTTLINTGEIDDVGNYTVGDLEFASINGPFALSAEYLYSWIHRNEQSTLNFNGYYLNASYFLTGESRLYSYPGAYFTGITAINNKKLGAWQILAQYSALDLNSQNINGGDEKNFSIGINWYINSITELMFNYVHADASANQAGPHTVANAYGLQLQLFF